jgi:hypothetical protein
MRIIKNYFRRRLGRIEADYVLLASGVIVAACICVHGEELISSVLMTLQKTTGIPIDSIRDFYVGIYQTVSFNFLKYIFNPFIILDPRP